jgi:hypothetical protein
MFFKKRKKPDAAKPAPVAENKPAPNADFFASPPPRPDEPRPAAPAPAPKPAPAPAPAPQSATVSSIAIADLSQLLTATGKPVRASIVGDWYAFGANQFGISTDSVPASEGDEFLATATVAALDGGAGDDAAQFGFGPIFLDAEGKVIRWFRSHDKPAQTGSEVQSKGRAPAGTVSAKLALRGAKSEQTEGVYTLGARNLRLEKAS